jgi:hypothetical protein
MLEGQSLPTGTLVPNASAAPASPSRSALGASALVGGLLGWMSVFVVLWLADEELSVAASLLLYAGGIASCAASAVVACRLSGATARTWPVIAVPAGCLILAALLVALSVLGAACGVRDLPWEHSKLGPLLAMLLLVLLTVPAFAAGLCGRVLARPSEAPPEPAAE